MKLNKPCPKCQDKNTLTITPQNITCKNCTFNLRFNCPLCNQKQNENTNPNQIKCDHCKQEISLEKIKYLIENTIYIDHKNQCKFCNSPTIYPKKAKETARCFFFPKCSGQTNLFETKTETLVFLDFETSGLEIEKENIIEIGALKINEEGIETTCQLLVKPENPISQQITAITGITNEMLDNASSQKESILALKEFIGTSTLVAHNAEFDMLWYLSTLIKHKIEIPNNPVTCTLEWAKENEESQRSLERLCKKYNIDNQNAHRALSDAKATKELFFIFKNQHPNNIKKNNLSDYLKITEKILSTSN